jgi:hypothetical protein
MRRQGHGRLVQCSSILGLVPMPLARRLQRVEASRSKALTLTMRMPSSKTQASMSRLIEPGPIRSRFAENAASWFTRNIDIENSVHRVVYEERLAKLEGGGTQSSSKLGPEAVHAALKRALEHRNPAPHYPVTTPAHAGMILKKLLPARLFYRLVSSRA